MGTPTMVTITVPLNLPLSLVNEIENECSRVHLSIADKLSTDLIQAYADRQSLEFDMTAQEILQGPTLTLDNANPAHQGGTFSPRPTPGEPPLRVG